MPRYSILAAIFLIPLLLFLSLSCEQNSPTEPKAAFFLTILSGNNQQEVQGYTLPTALTVLVTDKDGKAVPNKQVDFAIKEGEGTLSVGSINTDENGQASAILILGNQQGLIRVEAKISGTNITAIFTAVVEIHKPYSIEIAGGDGQVAYHGETLPQPLQVLVKDDRGRSFEGAVVTFSIDEGTGSLSALSDTSSVSGTAQTILTFSDTIGITKVIASLQGADSPAAVTFSSSAVGRSHGERGSGSIKISGYFKGDYTFDSAEYDISYYYNYEGQPMYDKGRTRIQLSTRYGEYSTLIVVVRFDGISPGLYHGSYDRTNYVSVNRSGGQGQWYTTANNEICEITITKFDIKEIAGTFTGRPESTGSYGKHTLYVEGDFSLPRD